MSEAEVDERLRTLLREAVEQIRDMEHRAASLPAPTREQARGMLAEVYASLPAVQCKGLCHDTCTTTVASELERELIRERGVELPPPILRDELAELQARGETPRCPALGPLGNCRVYDVRPLLCRAYGAIADSACEHRCMAEGWISSVDLAAMMMQVEILSELVTGVSWARGRREELR